jgi:hypothetical protein
MMYYCQCSLEVIFNTSVLVQEKFLQKNDMPHLNEDVSYVM